ncbi:MAG: hypothetical protein JST91_03075 [Actinobacteria bacterium]|nr:hypothetical protein [Actinomycetota bacterium]
MSKLADDDEEAATPWTNPWGEFRASHARVPPTTWHCSANMSVRSVSSTAPVAIDESSSQARCYSKGRLGKVIGTFQALFVALVAVLPGSLYTIALVNRGAGWAWRKDDAANQLIGFVGVSAAFHAVFAPATYWAYREVVATNALKSGHVSWWWWPLLLTYVVVPYGWGIVVAQSRRWGPETASIANGSNAAMSIDNPQQRAARILELVDELGFRGSSAAGAAA